jgi:hypothetical protein
VCKRGVRLNFIDTQVGKSPAMPPSMEWNIQFLDESREIASEYKGGYKRYAALRQEPMGHQHLSNDFGQSRHNSTSHQPLPPIQPILHDNFQDSNQHQHMEVMTERHHRPSHSTLSNSDSAVYTNPTMTAPSSSGYGNGEPSLTPPREVRNYLNQPEETLFMQVFVEEVGLWMDSMDPMKHVSEVPNLICYIC